MEKKGENNENQDDITSVISRIAEDYLKPKYPIVKIEFVTSIAGIDEEDEPELSTYQNRLIFHVYPDEIYDEFISNFCKSHCWCKNGIYWFEKGICESETIIKQSCYDKFKEDHYMTGCNEIKIALSIELLA